MPPCQVDCMRVETGRRKLEMRGILDDLIH